MEITKKLIKYNFNKGGNSKKFIVIHDTGNYDKGSGAIKHYNYFNGADRNSSAHYFVDDKLILQVVEDDDRSWHCGVKYGSNAPRKEVTNSNSIGVEICVNPDSNYDVAVEQTIRLVKSLMKKYNIPIENVVTHYEACLKTCPSSMSKNDWALWKKFKSKLEEKNMFKVGNLTVTNEKEYQKEAIEKAVKQGVFAGDGTTFDVSETMSKGDFCVILERLGLVK